MLVALRDRHTHGSVLLSPCNRVCRHTHTFLFIPKYSLMIHSDDHSACYFCVYAHTR